MEKNMNMSVKKESEMDFNNDLAFDLTVNMIRNYAKDCLVDKDMEMMDPMAGSYLLVHNLVVGLLVKADGFESELINVCHSAIEDAEFRLNKSKGE